MKLIAKKLVCAVGLALGVLAAGAETKVSGGNIVGLLRVDSVATNTIVAVPWVACSAEGSAIAVSNLVKTANLTAGDMLYALDAAGNSFNAWQLVSGAGGVLGWAAVKKVEMTGVATETDSAAATTLARGAAILLVRQHPEAGHFFLCGQYAAAAASTTITAGTVSTPRYHLVASPRAAAVGLNTLTWSDVDAADRIYVTRADGTTVELHYQSKDGKWCYNDLRLVDHFYENVSVPYETAITAGTGFWYASCGGTPTINW